MLNFIDIYKQSSIFIMNTAFIVPHKTFKESILIHKTVPEGESDTICTCSEFSNFIIPFCNALNV